MERAARLPRGAWGGDRAWRPVQPTEYGACSILFLDPLPILAFWAAFNATQLLIAWVAFGWDREPRRPLWSLPPQQLVYRQLMYLVVIDSVMVALMGTHLRWHPHARTGDVQVAEPQSA